METRNAWKGLVRAAREAEPAAAEEDFSAPQAPLTRREKCAGWLELCASAAVIAVSLAAIAAFLRLV